MDTIFHFAYYHTCVRMCKIFRILQCIKSMNRGSILLSINYQFVLFTSTVCSNMKAACITLAYFFEKSAADKLSICYILTIVNFFLIIGIDFCLFLLYICNRKLNCENTAIY